jgi:peptidoglycan/LPS O-acetylase OafA/YrhL
MIPIPDALRRRVTSIVLALYVGAFLGQALCALHESHADSPMGTGMDGPAAHVSSSTAALGLASVAAHGPSQDGEHPGTPGPDHSVVCASAACASALTTTADFGLEPLNLVPRANVAYLGEPMPPDTEMVSPPPRLG